MTDVREPRPVPSDLQAVLLWIAEHDGRIDAWWEQQKDWNRSFEKEVRSKQQGFELRLSAVEKRMIYVAGIASGFGSILGTVGYAILRGS